MRICSVSANQQFELDKQETDKMTLGLMILQNNSDRDYAISYSLDPCIVTAFWLKYHPEYSGLPGACVG